MISYCSPPYLATANAHFELVNAYRKPVDIRLYKINLFMHMIKYHTSEKQVIPLAKNKAKAKQSQQTLFEDEISAEDLALLSAAFSTLAQAFTFLSLLKVREDTQQAENQEGLDGLEINLPPFRRRS